MAAIKNIIGLLILIIAAMSFNTNSEPKELEVVHCNVERVGTQNYKVNCDKGE